MITSSSFKTSFARWAMNEQFCNVHKTELIEDSVPILYGTFAPEPAYVLTERKSTYPFASAFVRGPCWERSETHVKVQFCPTCREIWLNTAEGAEFVNYFAQDRPTLEQDIERFRAQQIDNARYGRNLRLLRVACYSILGAVICAFVSYFFTNGLAPGIVIGGLGGVMAGIIANRRAAQ